METRIGVVGQTPVAFQGLEASGSYVAYYECDGGGDDEHEDEPAQLVDFLEQVMLHML